MKPSEKKEKGKKCRVLANTIKKKPERNFNSSGNRSFLSKSTNPYITDLRNNNARLAHSLAIEKSKTAELFRRYTECQALVMTSKAVLRNVSTSIKNGLSKFRNGLDQMIEAADLLCAVTTKVATLCPELVDRVTVGNIGAANPANIIHQAVPSDPPVASSSCNSAASPERGPSTTVVSSVRQCAARPMVKGQVISNPTISLQRVTVPARHLGKSGAVKPTRGVQCNAPVDSRPFRLSNVPEEMNESHGTNLDVSQPSLRCYPSSKTDQSLSPTSPSKISMPHSHVLLERIPTRTTVSIDMLSPNESDEDQQLTVVHFGSINFSTDPVSPPHDLGLPSLPVLGSKRSSGVASPRKSSDLDLQNCSSTVQNSPGSGKRNSKGSPNTSHTTINSSNSDEYLTESSSEDEDLALQLAESKKCYLERARQEDLMEGTSWNYDEAGKYRGKPPRKKKMKMSNAKKSFTTESGGKSSVSKRSAEEQTQLKERAIKQPLKQKETQEPSVVEPVLISVAADLDASDLDNSKGNADGTSRLSLTGDHEGDPLQRTVLEEQDMSFTECISFNPCVLSEVARENSQQPHENLTSNEKKQESNVLDEPLPERTVHITQRSRGRKPPVENLGNYSLSPLSTSLNQRSCSQVENNENAPPKSVQKHEELDVLEKRTVPNKYEELSQKPSFVVLERLPSNIIYRNAGKGQSVNCEAPGITKRKTSAYKDEVTDNLAMRKLEASHTSEVTRSRSSGRKPGIRPPDTYNEEKNNTDPVPLTSPVKCFLEKPGPRQSKGRRKKVEKDMNDPPLSVSSPTPLSPRASEVTCSAPTSPVFSSGFLEKPGPRQSKGRRKKVEKDMNDPPLSVSSPTPLSPRASEVTCSAPTSPVFSSGFLEKPGPKQSKGRRKKVEKDMNDPLLSISSSAPLSPRASEVMCSAPTSPASASDHRPRRHAAPLNFKEPSLNKKLRRE